MADRLDAVHEVLARGEIPIFPGRCTLKDESVKPGKAARVFTILPTVINHVSREEMRCAYAAMRMYPDFFECMVGIDMSGNGPDFLVSLLSRVDPTLSAIDERDVTKLDKNWRPELWEVVAFTIATISSCANGDFFKCYSILKGMSLVLYELKGDLFHAPWNPSG